MILPAKVMISMKTSDDSINVLVILCFINLIFIIGKKIFEKFCPFCFCSIILSLILALFKIFSIPYAIGFLNVEIFKNSVNNDAYVFWSGATGLFYISLFIVCFLKREINIFIYFIIGLCCSVIPSVVLIISRDTYTAIVCGGLTLIEVILQVGAISYAKSNGNLDENQKMNNILIIDNYKYFIVLIIFTYVIFLFFVLICCMASCAGGERTAYYKDQYGNLYDINKNRIY